MWLWAEETESSVDFNIISLKSKISGLPRALIANLQATILGKHQHVAEVSDILVLYFIWCNKCFFYSSVCLRMAGLKYAIRRRKLAAAALAIFSRTLQLHCEVRLLSCIIMYYHVLSCNIMICCLSVTLVYCDETTICTHMHVTRYLLESIAKYLNF